MRLDEDRRDAIEDAVTEMFAANGVITSSRQVQTAVMEQTGLAVADPLVRQVMHKELRLGYRLARTVPVQSNHERCLVLRQQFALRMLPLLESGCFSSPPAHRVINIDQSWLNGTRFTRRVWVPSGAPATVTDKQVAPRISLIAALDTEGRLWFSLTQANTDSDVMILFFRKLTEQLDRESPGWEETTTILLDNAAWHTSSLMKARMAKMQLPICFTGPYSYASAPVVSD